MNSSNFIFCNRSVFFFWVLDSSALFFLILHIRCDWIWTPNCCLFMYSQSNLFLDNRRLPSYVDIFITETIQVKRIWAFNPGILACKYILFDGCGKLCGKLPLLIVLLNAVQTVRLKYVIFVGCWWVQGRKWMVDASFWIIVV